MAHPDPIKIVIIKKCPILLRVYGMSTISYPPCKKGIRPGICVKPVVSHEAGGRV